MGMESIQIGGLSTMRAHHGHPCTIEMVPGHGVLGWLDMRDA